MLEILNYMIFHFLNQKVIGLNTKGLKLKIMLLFLLIENGNTTQVVYSNFFDNPLIQINGILSVKIIIDWLKISKDSNYDFLFQSCGSANILYIDNKNTQYNVLIHRSFSLNPHDEVIIEFKLWKIDNWIDNQFLIYVDNEIILDQLYSCSLSAINVCRDTQKDEVTMISKRILHDRPSIQIVIFAQNGKWGISEFILSIREFNSIKSCDFNQCFDQRIILESLTSILISSINISEGWNDLGSTSSVIDFCHDLYYHKSQSNSFEKQISLDFHVAISLKLKIMILNSGTTTIILKIDDIIVQQWLYKQKWINYDHTDINFQGFWYHYTQTNVNIVNYAHTQPQIKITIQTSMNAVYTPWAPWFGIREFQLFTILQNLNYICKDKNINAFDGCFSFIYDCVQGCMNCINGICVNCLMGWQYIEINNSCIPICGDLILTQQEECDDGNEYPYDGCHNCKFSCPLNCNICQFGQCLQENNSHQIQYSNFLFDFKPNVILYHNQCKQSYYDLEKDGDFKNFECYLQGQNLVAELYQKIFIESIIMQYPILEQYIINQLNQIKIYQCKQNGLETCQDCENGFILSINQRECVPQCGDGIVQDYEICDDQNNLQQDGCYKCQQSCQLECLYCINGECSICFDGWQLINKTCQQICGDGLLAIQSNEQCDDGNQNDNDGCFQCLFECVPYCLYCIDQYNCLNCQKYFELVQNSCRPICGDSYIVEGLEECEDGNQIANDGCHNCQFQCEIDCITCINGKCKEYQKLEEPQKNDTEPIIQQIDQICNEGCLQCLEEKCQLCEQFSTLENGQCIKCGNGYKSKDELCDDGNTLNNDGCSNNCNIEQGWDCNNKNNQFSQCYKIALLSINFLNQSSNTQYVTLTYTKKVKLNESNQIFLEALSIFIQDINSNYFNLTIEPVTEIIFESVRDINYIIEITFLEKIEYQPKLIVSMNTVLLDENEIIVPTSSTDIELRIPQVMDSFQLQNTQRLQAVGQRLMMGLTGFGHNFWKFLIFYNINLILNSQISNTLQICRFIFKHQILYNQIIS
ncbi:unnamed protein product [Paramecium primaurelia]|uniref:EGF-like domain-containing protein n=1 Tax=Paramecium primaurelia TaxID=5886 RepID=A0A8S1JQS6_PARPR|nr:unnamed protein product [Paramecium primaurelia]